MIAFADYFYSKYYYGHSAASADVKGKATAHNHHRKAPALFLSLDFSECNGYLKGIASIDAQ